MTTARRDGLHKSSFGQWVRAEPSLDSRNAGLVVTDMDWVFHKYITYRDRVGDRKIQHLMFVEEKAFGREVPFSQRDTLYILSQFMPTNPGETSKKKIRTVRGDLVQVKWWGIHVLRFSDAGPEDSELIEWDGRQISLETLRQVLRFDVSPITLRSISDRRHHRGNDTPFLRFGESA